MKDDMHAWAGWGPAQSIATNSNTIALPPPPLPPIHRLPNICTHTHTGAQAHTHRANPRTPSLSSLPCLTMEVVWVGITEIHRAAADIDVERGARPGAADATAVMQAAAAITTPQDLASGDVEA